MLFSAVAALSTVVITVCVFFAAYTLVCGFPACAGKGFVLYSDGENLALPDNDLIIFQPCAVDGIKAGDYCVYRSAMGVNVGVVQSVRADEVVLYDNKEGSSVTVIPDKLVVGRAYAHNPSAGEAVAAVASAKTAITVVAAAIVVLELFSLLTKPESGFLSKDDSLFTRDR